MVGTSRIVARRIRNGARAAPSRALGFARVVAGGRRAGDRASPRRSGTLRPPSPLIGESSNFTAPQAHLLGGRTVLWAAGHMHRSTVRVQSPPPITSIPAPQR